MLVREIMKTHVVKTSPTASLAEAVDLMDIYQVDSLTVVDSEGKLCGMVSEEDISRALFPVSLRRATTDTDDPRLPSIATADKLANGSVGSIMKEPAIAVSELAQVSEHLRAFFVNDYTRLPVLSADGDIVGTLNRIDIIQAIFEHSLGSVAK